MEDLSTITYPKEKFNISFYNDFHIGKITLDDFEKLAYERYKLLNKLSKIRTSKSDSKSLHSEAQSIIAQARFINDYDKISHYLLSLCVCNNEDAREFFIRQELFLFRTRLLNEQSRIKEKYQQLTNNKLQEEKTERDFYDNEQEGDIPYEPYRRLIASQFQVKSYYVVDFQTVPMLVCSSCLSLISSIAQRKVQLLHGKAYIEVAQLIDVLCIQFEEQLIANLDKLKRSIHQYLRDPRIGVILNNLSQSFVGNDYRDVEINDDLTRANLPQIAERDFPLCMRSMTQYLIRHSHLKNDGRLQLIRFLKGCGMPMDECIAFFKQQFTRKIPADKFDKEYAYGIRFLYGKEGKRESYSPYDCKRIVNSERVLDSCNGCPFRYLRPNELSTYLKRYNVSNEDISTILDLVNDHRYDVACRLHYTSTHPNSDSDSIGLHPNEWFKASFEYFKEKAAQASNLKK